MLSQLLRPVEFDFAGLRDRTRRQPFKHGRVEGRIRIDHSRFGRPLKVPASKAEKNVFTMLQTQGVRMPIEDLFIDADRRHALPQFFDHPIERNVTQSGFRLRVAAANIAMTSREPDLLKPGRFAMSGLGKGGL